MNTKLTVWLAAMCLSAGAFAQTQPASKPSTSGTSNTGNPTAGQSTANSGEQLSTAMQNNSNAQNTKQPMPAAKHGKTSKSAKTRTTDCAVHTDGNTTTPATSAGDVVMGDSNCNTGATTKH